MECIHYLGDVPYHEKKVVAKKTENGNDHLVMEGSQHNFVERLEA